MFEFFCMVYLSICKYPVLNFAKFDAPNFLVVICEPPPAIFVSLFLRILCDIDINKFVVMIVEFSYSELEK